MAVNQAFYHMTLSPNPCLSPDILVVDVSLSLFTVHIRKTLFFSFHAFLCFFMLFSKKVEKSMKSQVLYLPECFPSQSKK